MTVNHRNFLVSLQRLVRSVNAHMAYKMILNVVEFVGQVSDSPLLGKRG